MPKVIYYAHSKLKYDTLYEKMEIQKIQETFPDAMIINPNTEEHQKFGRGSIQYFLDLVSASDVLVYSSINGWIGMGVYQEIQYARDHDILVYRVKCDGVWRPKKIVLVEYERKVYYAREI